MTKFSDTFMGRALSDKGEPSSKRVIGTLMIIFVCFLYSIHVVKTGDIEIEFFASLLAGGLASLGISEASKIAEIRKNKLNKK